jgi:hypothetical protein
MQGTKTNQYPLSNVGNTSAEGGVGRRDANAHYERGAWRFGLNQRRQPIGQWRTPIGGTADEGCMAGYRTRWNSMIQFVSHVFPESDEYACSQRAEVAVMCDQMNRVRVGLPLSIPSE